MPLHSAFSLSTSLKQARPLLQSSQKTCFLCSTPCYHIPFNDQSIPTENQETISVLLSVHMASWGLSAPWILLTLQVRVDLNSRARGQVLELIKVRLSLQGPWEQVAPNTHTHEIP